MLVDNQTLARIARGEVSLAFRRWRRPTVRTNGRLMTSAGLLEIGSVTEMEIEQISAEEAKRAGYASKEELLAELGARRGKVYRVELARLGPDPRIALREAAPDEGDLAEIQKRLDRLDAVSTDGPWTLKTLRVIRDHPTVRAAELCALVGQDRDRFKPNVRKLKNLGLTISLEVGYRLSPRGHAYLRARESEE